jgi:hypothetical protein
MAIHHVITPELIQKAFKKTSIYPLDPSVFTDKDFAPSLVYSTTAHLPASYPSEIPSSPMAASSDLEDNDFFPMAIDEHDLDSDSRSSNSCKESKSNDSESESDDLEGEISQQNMQPHTTHSTLQLSGPIPHPVTPSYVQEMMLMKEELWCELQHMYEQNGALVQTTQVLTAQLDATNAHCTMAQWALAQSRLELENVKKKKQLRKSIKLQACFMTHPELKEDFNKVEEEQHEKDMADTEKQARKKAKDEVCHTQIEHDIRSKTFDALSTLWCKDDFITLAGALKILRDGTVKEL